MATPRDIRRLAFQVLYQLDLSGEDAIDAIEAAFDEADDFSPRDREKAFELARGAHAARDDADKKMAQLAPDWPAHRQAAVDRAILRLAHFEMTSGKTSPKIVVNEAVELAKRYSTERSPSFINALLDKVLKEVLPGRATGSTAEAGNGAN